MDSALVYSPGMAGYCFGPEHPLRPERFTLAVALMEAYGLVPPGTTVGNVTAAASATPLAVMEPARATDEELLLVHSPVYVAAVKQAGESPRSFGPLHGIGSLDTPAFARMHEASALIAGGTLTALREVLAGRFRRAFAVAGGLHHAHRDHASGFCVYNDAAVGIAAALDEQPDLRVCYIDIDAHHGDGVQAAFYDDPRVLTISIHETGLALFPGTGFTRERGAGEGLGSAVNVPLPPMATDACYRLAFDEVVAPRTVTFAPDLIVAQCGADAHHDDPLTTLGMTLAGHRWLAVSIAALADDVCRGRLVALGGGGYGWENVVPRAWTNVAAALAGVDLAEALPAAWREQAERVSGVTPPFELTTDRFEVEPVTEERLLAETRAVLGHLAAGS
jgi:acetoin utilization protein AcuC